MDNSSAEQLFRSIVQHSNDLITVFDEQGQIVFINDAALDILGALPNDFLGRSLFDVVHPDERERAATTLAVARDFGPAPGTTHFRIQRADGSYIALEMTAGQATDGSRHFLTTTGRPSDTRDGLERALLQLVGGEPLETVMLTVCDTLSWRPMRSRVAIVWTTPDGREHRVTQGGLLPDALLGRRDEPDSPFAMVRASGIGVQASDLSMLSPSMRALAVACGLGGYWIEPVRSGDASALIVVWTIARGHPPSVHVQGMSLARSIVEVILRWATDQWHLDFAANHDELTRLPNRKPFYRALDGTAQGAVLYCDLDGFKAVNDLHGHAAGDEVLRQVAERLRRCVREADLVARLGGDEFAVLCPGSSAADAEVLSDRIRAAIAPEFTILDLTVQIGISIGMSHTTLGLDQDSVAAADRMLVAAKAARRMPG